MHPIIYDVAVSLDGFISGRSGDISNFAHDGPVVEDYAVRLGSYTTAIMGRKTYASIGKPLPHRLNIVISRSLPDPNDTFKELRICRSMDEAMEVLAETQPLWGNQAFIIGGGEIYRQTVEHIQAVYLTRISPSVEGDTYYPIEALTAFRLQSCSDPITENGFRFQFERWHR